MDLIDLPSRDALLHAVGDDTFARLDPPADVTGWAVDGAVSFLRSAASRPPNLFAWGPRVGDLLDGLRASGIFADAGITGVSVPFAHRAEIERRFTVLGGGDWDWMWTARRVPAPRGHERIVELDDTADADEIAALAAVENPRFEGFPGTGVSERWLGARDASGAIIACGAVQRLPAGTAHLGGILVAARHRGEGLGRAISAMLTDRVVAAEGVCTLGMYSDNVVARTLYHSLGYVTDKAWASRQVSPVGAAAPH